MTLEQIKTLEVKDCWKQLLMRLVTFEPGESYQIANVTGDWWNKIVLPGDITIPTREQFAAELIQYKAELVAEENARLAECARVDALTAKFMGYYNADCGVPSFRKVWPEVANPLAFFNANKNDKNFDFKFNEVDAHEILVSKTARISELYKVLNTEVYAEMARVFGTSNAESATANQATWALMLSSPASFVGSLGFTTEAQVTAYAAPLQAAALEYAIWRMNRIEQFRQARAAILAE